MKLTIDYEKSRDLFLISAEDFQGSLWDGLTEAIRNKTMEIKELANLLSIPTSQFASVRVDIGQYCQNHDITDVDITASAQERLISMNETSYDKAVEKIPLRKDFVKHQLLSNGFLRTLTENQLNNVCKIGPLPAGATFSVPGAGKTTEALAFFFLNAQSIDKLLVVAPKNAFSSWEEQLLSCTGDKTKNFVRLRGGYDNIRKILSNNPRFLLITYQQFPRVVELIKDFLENNATFMFLDESHRIKSGLHGITPEAVLSCCFAPKRKLILSGTPMPQSMNDLIPQFKFLYPEIDISPSNPETVVQKIQPVYVRTTKAQLGLPEVHRKTISLEMSLLQRELYDLLKQEINRQIISLPEASKRSLRELGRRIVKIVQFVSNPSLLASDVDFLYNGKIGELLQKKDGPKIEYACQRAIELASSGKKVLIWSQFVKNVELITERLDFLGADYIHGGVDAGSDDEEDTREWKIKEFHNNPKKMVLVANPAAASEGISLHKICHNAIYVDRSFNAAHYLQSEDRIHRLGLLPEENPEIEILECKHSIDQVIDERLRRKIDLMAKSLNDPSLTVDTIPSDPEFVQEDFSEEDIDAVLTYLRGEK